MNFPNMVYKCPGPHHCYGGTFETRGVKNQEQADDFIEAGWSETLPEAMVKYGIKQPEVLKPVEQQADAELEVLGDELPPTRAELEQQAIELGIRFKKNTTDAELNDKINQALEG